MSKIEERLKEILKRAGVTGDIVFTAPPKPEMGDLCFPCFEIAKTLKQNPAQVAKDIVDKLKTERLKDLKIIERVEAMGPYVNFFLNGSEVAEDILKIITKEKKKYGTHTVGKKAKTLVEYGCPNPLKTFHLGHLRNLVTGESVARVLENAGFKVVRTNYQGDVGMHVAKTLWGVLETQNSKLKNQNFDEVKKLPLAERIAYLGKAYAYGAQKFEADESAKQGIVAMNRRVYEKDKSILNLYKTTRKWSLDYFETIYKKLGAKYNKYYFESEMYARGLALVNEFVKKDIFQKSEGAIIFPGSKYGSHDRVFVNSEGFTTYEAKDLALAERQFKDNHPARIIHVVGKDQTEYFKVVFKAIELVIPESKGKEQHLVGGYLQLKGDAKMSSRTGNVVTGDTLIEKVEEKVKALTDITKASADANIVKKVSVAALKYTMLKVGVSEDIAFDMEASVSMSGDSGPYLLYIVARIKSILRKSEIRNLPAGRQGQKSEIAIGHVEPSEKQLLLKLAEFPEATKKAAEELDPSKVAKYLFDLAQSFNTFYHACPVLQAEDSVKNFRLQLIDSVEQVMTKGLYLLGIETVEEM